MRNCDIELASDVHFRGTVNGKMVPKRASKRINFGFKARGIGIDGESFQISLLIYCTKPDKVSNWLALWEKKPRS